MFSSAAEDHRRTSVEAAAARIGSPAPGSFLLAAFQEGNLAGTAGFYREQEPKSRHKGRVWGVYVTECCRGRGIGRQLMSTLIDRARPSPGLEQIILSATTEQTAAMQLYESLGFQRFGREPRALFVNGMYLDEDYLVLSLR